jgi:hypothetical protein
MGVRTSEPDDSYKTDRDPRVVELPRRIEDLEEVRRYVEAIDFTMMKKKMESKEHGGLGWSRRRLDYAERLYKNWLFLQRKHEGVSMPPSEDIDAFWHWHILDTRAYHRDTAAIFGYYVHHFPYFGMRGEGDFQDLLDAWERTQELYLAEFGEEIYEFDEEEEEGEGAERRELVADADDA